MLNWVILYLTMKLAEITLGRQEYSLFTRVNIELKKILSHQIINLPFVALDLVLNPHDFRITVLVELTPLSLDLRDPDLMGCVTCCHVG